MRKLGLNLGSGQRPFRTTEEIQWVNIDSTDRPGQQTDLLCDGRRLPYNSDIADYVVLHHVLEHLGCGEGGGLIREAYRVLQPGGSLIVCVPDMDALCRKWMTGGMPTQIFMTNLYGAYMGDESDRHKWGYESASLHEVIEKDLAWGEIRKFNWRDIPGASICRDWWILAIEAVK